MSIIRKKARRYVVIEILIIALVSIVLIYMVMIYT